MMLIVHTATDGENRSRNRQAEDLIGQMATGDVSAMGGLYRLIGDDVYAYALSKTASRVDAEDITHDTFVQIWKHAPTYTPMGKPLAWVFTVEMNLIRKSFNRSSRTVPLDESIRVKGEGEEEDLTEQIANSELLRQLLEYLSDEEREILTLHIVSGMKHREIASLLGKPLSTVLSKYNRAIKRLRLKIKKGGSN